jgi:CheY-like chemotaxis protein
MRILVVDDNEPLAEITAELTEPCLKRHLAAITDQPEVAENSTREAKYDAGA